MANTTEDCINQMSREDFFQYAVAGLECKNKCCCHGCSECALDYSYFRKLGTDKFTGHNGCGDVIGYIGKRLEKELATLKTAGPEKGKPEAGDCSSCIYYRGYSGTVPQIEPQKRTIERAAECKGCKHCKEVGGVLFCEMWHNTTVPEAFCCYHEPTEPIIINDIPGIELDAVKVDGMSVDEWIGKEMQAGGYIDELPF